MLKFLLHGIVAPLVARLEELEGRLQLLQAGYAALAQRPDVLTLDPDSRYILVVPEQTGAEEFNELCSALRRFPNVVVISTDRVQLVSFKQ